jgi:hypothetical protein
MSTRPDNPGTSYLPERYRQKLRAKKQRRIYKKMVAAGIAIIIVIIAAFLLFGGLLQLPLPSPPVTSPAPITVNAGEQPMSPGVNVTVAITPGYRTGTGISALYSPDMLSQEKAVSILREEYPGETYTLNLLNLTDRYPGHRLYEFSIQPAVSSSTETESTVFIDAVTGEPYTPGQEDARITAQQAQDIAGKAFATARPDRVRVRYHAGPGTGRTWNFTIMKGTGAIITGTLDAETGLISSFTRPLRKPGRPAEPVLDLPAARKIADQYLPDRNGPVAVTLIDGRYFPLGSPSDPVAGQYIFVYRRVVNDFPCDMDGFIVGVDAVNGEITAYDRHWNAPDNAFSVTSEPLVIKREATFAVLQKAQETYPALASGLRILSAEIRWKDQHPAGITPRPGSIPLGWKIEFDDDIIRANSSAEPAVAWVDVQTGSILDFEYRH